MAVEPVVAAQERPSSRAAFWRPLGVGLGNLLFRIRDALLPAAFCALLVGTRATWPAGHRSWDLALDLLGLELALAGQALRALVIGLAYIRRGGKDRQVHANVLVVDGLFAHCRNPLYVGNLMVLGGLLLLHNATTAYLIGLPSFVLAYRSIVAAEEDYLLRRFGDSYRAYCARVPRFGFSLSGIGATMRQFRFDWRRLLRKEYGATFAGASAILVTFAWGEAQVLGASAVRDSLPWMLLVWIQLVGAYAMVRWLKKSGRLGRG